MKFPTIKSKKDSLYITLFFLFSIACIAGLRYEQRLEMQKGIAEKIIRFHVIANSDTKADQNLKLAVRDAVGIKMSGLLKDAADRSRSEAVIRKNMEDMKQTAEKVIAERGYDYDVDICLTDTDFPVKTYGAYTFPAGNYEALEPYASERKKPDCFGCGGLWLGRVRVPADADRRFLFGCRRRRPAGA